VLLLQRACNRGLLLGWAKKEL